MKPPIAAIASTSADAANSVIDDVASRRAARSHFATICSPVRDMHAVLPVAICYAGPVARALAQLETLRGETRAADALCAAALDASRALGARPMQARILLEHGELVASMRALPRVRAALSDAAELAGALGRRSVHDRARALLG